MSFMLNQLDAESIQMTLIVAYPTAIDTSYRIANRIKTAMETLKLSSDAPAPPRAGGRAGAGAPADPAPGQRRSSRSGRRPAAPPGPPGAASRSRWSSPPRPSRSPRSSSPADVLAESVRRHRRGGSRGRSRQRRRSASRSRSSESSVFGEAPLHSSDAGAIRRVSERAPGRLWSCPWALWGALGRPPGLPESPGTHIR